MLSQTIHTRCASEIPELAVTAVEMHVWTGGFSRGLGDFRFMVLHGLWDFLTWPHSSPVLQAVGLRLGIHMFKDMPDNMQVRSQL
jgi:hypothetical protein